MALALDDGDHLDVAGAQIVAQVAIDLQRVFDIGGINGAENVCLDLVSPQDVPAPNYFRMSAAPLLVHAQSIVEMRRAIDADPDQVVVFAEEGCPVIVDQRAVGLYRVPHPLLRAPVLLGQFDRTAIEVEPAQHRLAALPHELDIIPRRREMLPDMILQNIERHQVALAGIERLLLQIEAITAIEIAGRPGRLDHQVITHGATVAPVIAALTLFTDADLTTIVSIPDLTSTSAP